MPKLGLRDFRPLSYSEIPEARTDQDHIQVRGGLDPLQQPQILKDGAD